MIETLKILILEDLESDQKLLQNEITKAGIMAQYRCELSEMEFIRALNDFRPDIIISDYNLPSFDGMEALKIAKKLDPSTPFILVTGSLNEEIAVEIMKEGADDYILKDNLKKIGPAIEHAVERKKEKDARQRAERELQESEERYRMLVEVAPVAILVHRDLQIVFANESAVQLLGATNSQELKGMRILDFIHSDSHNSLIENYGLIKRNNARAPLREGKAIRLDGNFVEIQIVSSTIMFNGLQSYLTVIGDITERKRAEEKLKLSEARYRTLIETSPNGIALLDLKGRIIFCNRQKAWLHGYDKPEELVGMESLFTLAPGEKKRVLEEIRFLLLVGTITNTEYIAIKKDGETFPAEFSASVIFDEQGKPVGIMSVMTDITERKKNELELIKAKERAEGSDKLKTTLLANMSHELRTPMNGILGFAQILKEEIKDEQYVSIARKIFTSGKRLMSTIESILDLSELEADRMQVKIEPHKLLPIVSSVSKLYRNEIEEKKLELKIFYSDENITANIDEMLFKQVLKNLLDNSMKFTDNGEICINLDKEETTPNKKYAVISIRDTGIGIPENYFNTIFEPFRQASEGTSRSHEGIGLGLTIAMKMIKLMDGSIEVKSEQNKGATFFIRLQLIDDAVPETIHKETMGKMVVTGHELPTILLVEDNFLNKDVTVLYLKKVCKVDHAPNGVKAVEMARTQIYPLVLMDINLGVGMDGYEAMDEVRKIDGYQTIPFVALTGYAMKGDKERFLAEGFTAYLAKPFERFELIETVKSLISV